MNNTQSGLLVIILLIVPISILYILHPILTPFVLGAVIAYLGDPVVDRLEEARLPRTLAVLVFFAFFLVAIVFAILLILPPLMLEFETFASIVPKLYKLIVNDWIPSLHSYLSLTTEPVTNINWSSKLSDNWGTLGKMTTSLLQKFASSGAGLIQLCANLVLIPVVGFYLLRDWDVIIANILDLIPSGWRNIAKQLMDESDEVISAFIRGQLLVMLALGLIYSIGLSAVGIQMALVLGVVAGLASIIPYLGFVVGVTLASITGYVQYHDWEIVGLVWLVFIIGQFLESTLLTPVLIGDKVGLHPVTVIFSLMAGGVVAGFAGLLIAVPIAALLMVFLRHLLIRYRSTDFYKS